MSKLKNLDPYELLRTMCEESSQVRVARKLGISRTHINGIVKSKKRIGPDVLEALGIEKVISVTYRYK